MQWIKYGDDPSIVAEVQSDLSERERLGCAGCKFRQPQLVWGKGLCSLPNTEPGPRGFCKLWELRE